VTRSEQRKKGEGKTFKPSCGGLPQGKLYQSENAHLGKKPGKNEYADVPVTSCGKKSASRIGWPSFDWELRRKEGKENDRGRL